MPSLPTAITVCVALLSAACSSQGGPEEIKLGKRSRDAGPAVVIVDKATDRVAQAPVAEKEPNDAKSGGQALTVPGAVRGRIDVADDWDVYKVTLPAAGTLRATLTAVDDADLVLEVQGPGGEIMAVSDDGPAKTAEAIPNLFVQPGTVSIVVHEYRKPEAKKAAPRPGKGQKAKKAAAEPAPAAAPASGGRNEPSQPYVLEVTLGPPPAPGEEHEPNGETAFADDLALGAAGRGYIGWKRDVDMWKVALDGVRDDEALAVDVDGVPGVALRVAVLDGTGAQVVVRRGQPGAALSLRSVQIRDKNPIYFVAVTGDKPNIDETYTLRVATAAVVLDEETEPNDTPAAASPLADVPGTESGVRVGTLPAGDVDLYKLEAAPAERTLALALAPPSTVAVELSVVGEDGHVLAGPAASGKKGAEEKIAAATVPAGIACYVRIAVRSGGSDTERYKLRWTVGAAEHPQAPAAVPGVDD